MQSKNIPIQYIKSYLWESFTHSWNHR